MRGGERGRRYVRGRDIFLLYSIVNYSPRPEGMGVGYRLCRRLWGWVSYVGVMIIGSGL